MPSSSDRHGSHSASAIASGLAIAALAIACASTPPRPALSGPVHDLNGVNCPEERIRVLDTRTVEDDTVYVLDACGKRVEVGRGLAVPMRQSEVSVISAENELTRPSGMEPQVAPGVVAMVKRKVQRWCVLESASAPDASAMQYRKKTNEELEECQKHLANLLRPFGTERDPETGEESYTFTVGQFLFTVKEALYDARGTSGAGGKRVAVPTEALPEDERPHKAANKRIWFGHVELGLGMISNAASSGDYASVSWHTHTAIGLKATPDLGFGFVVGTSMGIAEQQGAMRPHVFEIGAGIVYDPTDEGFHLDANASVGALSYGFEQNYESGPLFGAGIGYHGGERRKKQDVSAWSGFGVDLRGMYTFTDRHETFAISLAGGMHAW